jgi:sugar lactone lactonase YvrE
MSRKHFKDHKREYAVFAVIAILVAILSYRYIQAHATSVPVFQGYVGQAPTPAPASSGHHGAFSYPTGVAFDASGNMYVSDGNLTKVQKFNSNGNLILTFGSNGTSTGKFDGWIDASLATDAQGNVYVGECGSTKSRVQKFDSHGNFLMAIGDEVSSAVGKFNCTEGIAVDSLGNIFVADFSNNRIEKFDSSGNYLLSFGSEGSADGQLAGPGQIVLASSSLYVADERNHRIDQFDLNGNFINKFGSQGTGDGQLNYPWALAQDSDGNMYIGEITSSGNRLQKFDSHGNFIAKIGGPGFSSADGQFSSLYNLAIHDGGLFEADGDNARVQKFDLNLNYITKWAPTETEGDHFAPFGYATGVAFDSYGNMLVADDVYVRKFDPSGNLLLTFGGPGVGDGKFAWMEGGIAVDSQDNVYVTNNDDNNGYQIQKFDSNGNFLMGIGGPVNDQNVMEYPEHIFIDTAGYIYVAECGSVGKIQKFDSNGNLVLDFTTYYATSSPSGGRGCPVGVAVDAQGNIFEAEYGSSIQKYDASGNYISYFGQYGQGNGDLYHPYGIALDPSGNIYVIEQDNQRVSKFDANGNFILKFGTSGSANGQFDHPYGIALDALGNIYIADGDNVRVQKFDPLGNYMSKWSVVSGNGNGQFNTPQGVAHDSQGNIYVVDQQNSRIQKFDSSGTYISQFGSDGSGDGQFHLPQGIFIDATNTIYIADPGNNRIETFDSNGNFLMKFGSAGSGNGQLGWPIGITVDTSGYIYVAEFFNSRIQKFDANGNYISKFGTHGINPGEFNQVYSIVQKSNGNFYISDYANNWVSEFDSSGNFVRVIGTSSWNNAGSGNGQFHSPTQISLDSSGNLYVTDSINNRVQEFDPSGNFLMEFGSSGTGQHRLYAPVGISILSDGRMVIADNRSHLVSFWGPSAPLLISSLSTSSTASSTLITWTTDDSGTSQVEFGPTTSYGSSTGVFNTSPKVTSHSVTLSGLTSCAVYNYRVKSANDSSTTTSPNATFTTDNCTAMASTTASTATTASTTATSSVTLSAITISIS